MALPEIVALLHKYKLRFLEVFKRSLFLYFDPLTGFDSIGFGDFLQVPDDTSMKDFVQKCYGDEGVSIIEALIHIHDWQPIYGAIRLQKKLEWCECGAIMHDGVLQPAQTG